MVDIARYVTLDAVGLGALIKAGDLHPREALTLAMTQIEKYDDEVNAVSWKRYDRALREAEEPLPDSPVSGVPFLIKDMGQALAGAPNTMGSQMRQYIVADHDSNLVARYKAAGLLILGQTAAPEFGAAADTKPILHGQTNNPWDLSRSPGGSSGGAAAAVAARYVPVAHASDGGGSIRIPSAMCGLFGMKPSRGRTPKGPDIGESWFGMSIDHVVGHSVRDSAAILDLTRGPDAGALYAAHAYDGSYLDEVSIAPDQLRIAISTKPLLSDKMDPICASATELAGKHLEALGHRVEYAEPDLGAQSLREAMSLMVAADTAESIESSSDDAGQPPSEALFEQSMWVVGLVGQRLSALDLAKAIKLVKSVGRTVAPFFEDYDVLVQPTLARPPWKQGALDPSPRDVRAMSVIKRIPGRRPALAAVRAVAANSLDAIPNTPLWNATGQPSMNVPLVWSDVDGTTLPIGVQFTGRFGDEATLYRLAGQLERAHPWAHRMPGLLG